jgi:uncharacterized repeat protein (TIGR01451 family)
MPPETDRIEPENRFVVKATLYAASAIALCLSVPAIAAGTRAGTVIDNTASATYDQNGTPITIDSNVSSLRVDELLDAVVAWSDPSDVQTTPNATGQVLAFALTNTGNGAETFSLATVSTIGGDQYDPTVTSVVLDDGDGVYEPAIDTVYVSGANDPLLNPDQSLTVFVVSTTPTGVADGNRGGVLLTASAATGTGAPGTGFAGQGEGGGNAIVGTSGADGSDDGYYQVSSATVALVKSAAVADPFGGTSPVPGSTITYTIIATTSGSGSLANLAINDAVPTGTTYVAGSMTLAGASLTDAADADAGRLAANAISVALGTVPGGQTRTVTFRVTIN